MHLSLRYDLCRSPGAPGFDVLYAECLEQCAWADRNGFTVVRLHEHHGRNDGYLPSPAVLGAAIAARTERIKIRFSVLVLPLHHPVRIAEDIAVLDQLSRGRVEVAVAAGYVGKEFATFGQDITRRAEVLEEKIGVLRSALSGRPFDFDGVTAHVTPGPYGGREIPIHMGGSSPLAARIAARAADGFEPSFAALEDLYREECARIGRQPGWLNGPGVYGQLFHIAEDPDAAWARIAPFALHEMNQYAADSAVKSMYKTTTDPDTLRGPGAYHVVTPDEAYQILRDLGPHGAVAFTPLLCGMDPDLGWESLELFTSKVLPRLRADGYIAEPESAA